MNVAGKCDGAGSILRNVLAQAVQCVQPHRQIMEVLPIPIRSLADANSSWPTKYPINVPDQFFGVVKISLLIQLAIKRTQ